MLRELSTSWKDNKDVFLLEGVRTITYQQLRQDLLEKEDQLNLKSLNNQCIVVAANHSYETYLTVLAILSTTNTLMMVPGFQFNDTNYRTHLVHELAKSLLFLEADSEMTRLESSISSGQFETLNPNAKTCFIVRTSGSSGSKYKFVLHSLEKFYNKYKKRGRHFDRTLAFSPLESIAGTECLLETLVVGASIVLGGDKMNPELVTQLLQSHGLIIFRQLRPF